ncbi:MAG: AAA family ATPase [Limnothrix sp.]
MIETIHIENYKSIHSLDVELGRVTVLIGENGSGKSNILEAIAFASAATQDKLDNEFLASRGIRVNSQKFMRSAFDEKSQTEDISITITNQQGHSISLTLNNDNNPYSKWEFSYSLEGGLTTKFINEISDKLINEIKTNKPDLPEKSEQSADEIGQILQKYITQFVMPKVSHPTTDELESDREKNFPLSKYIIFSPENTALRKFEEESQIEPLGVNGEGLYKLLRVTADTQPHSLEIIKKHLRLIGWFKDFLLSESKYGEHSLIIEDKYIADQLRDIYNHKNTNEGFLFILFYIVLFVSDLTPAFFAIDNIDASLNPKLCTEMTKSIVQLAKKYDKQVILTTHNPAILDGIDLTDEEQKILVVSRNRLGHTKVRSIKPPKVREGKLPIKLSEAFLNGMIGGLPDTF